MVIAAVWITSAMYSAPRFFWVQTIDNKMKDGQTETICATHRQKYNSKVFDIINFVLLYVVPLAVMTVSYFLYIFLISHINPKQQFPLFKLHARLNQQQRIFIT